MPQPKEGLKTTEFKLGLAPRGLRAFFALFVFESLPPPQILVFSGREGLRPKEKRKVQSLHIQRGGKAPMGGSPATEPDHPKVLESGLEICPRGSAIAREHRRCKTNFLFQTQLRYGLSFSSKLISAESNLRRAHFKIQS